MRFFYKRGFTLIELLVVIAIIAILAGILLVTINPKERTSKAKDVKYKQNLVQLRPLSTLYLDSNSNSYENFCTNDQKAAVLIPISNAVCYDSQSAWAAESTLTGINGEARYCVDSTGYAGDTTSALGVNDTSCNH